MEPLVVLVAVNAGISPDPLAPKPMAVLELIQVKVVPFTGETILVTGTGLPIHGAKLGSVLIVGLG